MDIIQKLSSPDAQNIIEQDLDEWVVPQLVDHYAVKIKGLATYAYGSTVRRDGLGRSVSVRAFTERAKAELRSGVFTFFFVTHLWRNDRDINIYLLACLNRLAYKIKLDVGSTRRINTPICPACRLLGQKEFLVADDGMLRCYACFNRMEAAENDPAQSDALRLSKIFSIHSRGGNRCPDCERFIPQSYGTSCPYDDCSWFLSPGSELEPMAHPVAMGVQNNVSLDVGWDTRMGPCGTQSCKPSLVPIGQSYEGIKNESCESAIIENISFNEKYNKELTTLNEVIDSQIMSLKISEGEKPIQKLLMYQAYKNLVKNSPDDMISYLVHMKVQPGAPIQSRIFQEYIRLVENSLPFTLTKGGTSVEICSLMDENLGLFLGVSEFEATIKSDYTIPNNTVETYVGGRKMKCFGPCFIGMLISVKDRNTNEDLMAHVSNYTFAQINIKQLSLPIGLPVTVNHFRIASHYELMSLVNLQRLRKRIVDSTYFRLNGKRRITK